MQDRTRSFFDIKSLFHSSKRSRFPNTTKAYHYQKRESPGSAKQSTITDERTVYILERSLIDPHMSNDATLFRQLSVREPPPSPPAQQTSLRSSKRSSGLSGVLESDTTSSADSHDTLIPPSFSSQRRSASPQLPRRRGRLSSPELTPRPHTSSGQGDPPFSHTAQQDQSLTPNTRDTSYSRPTPSAYSFLRSHRPYYQNGPSVELQPPPASTSAPPVAEPIDPAFSLRSRYEPNRSGPARPATHQGYRDRMLVHAPVNGAWETH